ncbi:MAG: hypothetical protein AB3N20_22570 [Rhizobiaceae bacterium]
MKRLITMTMIALFAVNGAAMARTGGGQGADGNGQGASDGNGRPQIVETDMDRSTEKSGGAAIKTTNQLWGDWFIIDPGR